MADDAEGAVVQFIAVTDADSSTAQYYLDATSGNVEAAVNLFWEMGGGSTSRGGSSTSASAAQFGGGAGDFGGDFSPPAMGNKTGGDGDYIRPYDQAKTDCLLGDTGGHRPYAGGPLFGSMPGMMMPGMMMPGLGDAMAGNPFQHYGAPPVRPPSPPTAFGGGQNSEDAGEDDVEGSTMSAAESSRHERLADLFAPPRRIMFPGGFQEARQAAKDQKRWLLVNIQDNTEFDSHRLNRDTWKDETVECVIQSYCIFWQMYHTTSEGSQFCQRYGVHAFPYTSVIDPFTGREFWSRRGFMDKETALEQISDHVTNKQPGQGGAKMPPPQKPAPKPLHERSEEEQLAAAIAASMEQDGSDEDGYGNDEVMIQDGPEPNDSEFVSVVGVKRPRAEGGSEQQAAVGGSASGAHASAQNGNASSQTTNGSRHPPASAPSQMGKEPADKGGASAGLALGRGAAEGAGQDELDLSGVEVGEEPGPKDPNGTRLQLRFPGKPAMVRRFNKSRRLDVLYKFVQTTLAESGGRPFDIKTTFPPPKSLRGDLAKTFAEAGLQNTVVTVVFTD